MAFARVAPIKYENASIGTTAKIDSLKPDVFGEQNIVAMFRDVTATGALQDFLIGAATVLVQRQKFAAIFCRPVFTLVDHGANVCVPAAKFVRSTVA